jgi:hypothetical protein
MSMTLLGVVISRLVTSADDAYVGFAVGHPAIMSAGLCRRASSDGGGAMANVP